MSACVIFDVGIPGPGRALLCEDRAMSDSPRKGRLQVERHILIDASARRVFAIYADVANWPAWDPDTRRASLDGPFAAGSTGRLTPTRGRAVTMRLTRVEPDVCFTVQADIPLFRMVFEHELVPQRDAVRVTHRATFTGPLSFLLGRMLVRQLESGLPVTLGRLKRLAEGRAVQAAATP